MNRQGSLHMIALILIIIGGLNWGLVGLFNLDLVGTVFGGTRSMLSRIIFTLVGIAAIYEALVAFSKERVQT